MTKPRDIPTSGPVQYEVADGPLGHRHPETCIRLGCHTPPRSQWDPRTPGTGLCDKHGEEWARALPAAAASLVAALPSVPGEEQLLAALLATPPSVPPELAEILRRADQDRQLAALLAAYEKVRDGMRQGYADGHMQRFLRALDALRETKP